MARALVNKQTTKQTLKKGGDVKKSIPKAQGGKGIKTAGQAYMKYVPGAEASDTLGVSDPANRFGYPSKTTIAQQKMLDLTYGNNRKQNSNEEDSGNAIYNRVPQTKKDVKTYTKDLQNRAATGNWYQKKGGSVGKPAASGKSTGFPDLNKDGKVTKADILKGRGVIKKKGGTTKKK